MLKPCEDYYPGNYESCKDGKKTIKTFSFKPVKINVGYIFS